jgi:flagellar biosynthetic protein FliQ
MTPDDVIFMSQQAIEAMVHVALPMLMTSLIIGLVVTVFQALTQIQDPNLQFTPKIVGTLIAVLVLLPYIGTEIYTLTFDLFRKVILVGKN